MRYGSDEFMDLVNHIPSDVYMLTLGGRYGSIEEESGKSYTELEYHYASSKNMPVFAIILANKFLHNKATQSNDSSIFETENTKKYDLFKAYFTINIVKFVDNIDQISTVIHSQLNYIMTNEDFNLVGWIRSNTLPSNNSSSDYNIFSKYEPTFSSSKTLSRQVSKSGRQLFDKKLLAKNFLADNDKYEFEFLNMKNE